MIVLEYWQPFAAGASRDIILTLVTGVASLVLGVAGAMARLYGGRLLGGVVYWYVELIRGIPAILQLFLIFFGLTQFGIDLSPLTAAVIWLVAYGTGYAVEIFRAGIMEVPPGQREAAAALGMSGYATLMKIIVPQAWVTMLPNITSYIILLLKNTTILYLIGYGDVMYQAKLGIGETSQPGVFYMIAAVIYLVIALVMAWIGLRMEKRTTSFR